MVQIYHFYGGKANDLMIVCGVLKSFSTFLTQKTILTNSP